jgi:hypothetical protein
MMDATMRFRVADVLRPEYPGTSDHDLHKIATGPIGQRVAFQLACGDLSAACRKIIIDMQPALEQLAIGVLRTRVSYWSRRGLPDD